jgi:hypothetical protein
MKAYQFRSVRKLAAVAAMALGASFAGSSVASAGTSVVDFTSNTNFKGLGSFSGTATLDSSTDLLTVVMNNTSSKGYLYGLAFDLESGEKAKDVTVDKHGFKGVGKQGVRVRPYGKYEAGAIDTGSNRRAVAAGAGKTLVFQITGAPSDLTAFDLLDNPKGESVVAEFRGFRHGKTDHAAATVVIPPVAPAVILGSTGNSDPTPSTGGTIVTTTTPTTGSTGSTGGKTTGGGTITLPGGGGQSPMAVPLPSAALSGMAMLALVGGVMAKRKLAGMLA